ncbi:MAG: methionyl-tRNA formyltransferase, partial [Thermoguttaceae bacterium]
FAVPAFEQIYATPHGVAALVTAPVRMHRGRAVEPPSPLRRLAGRHGTPIVDPEDINAPESQEQLRRYAADLLVVCDYGQILKRETLAAARLGGINLHGSLLPKYRGAAPINWAIFQGETETGVTVIHMTPQIDAGPSIAQARTPIGAEETAAELEPRLAELGAGLIRQAIDDLEADRMHVVAQDAAQASKAPRLKKSDGAIDWTRPAPAIRNQIRALEPWPKTYTFCYRRAGPPLRLILGPATVVQRPPGPQEPGTVLEAAADRLLVAAGREALALQSVQPSGKRLLSIEEFLRGYHVRPGDRLGPEWSVLKQ